MSDKETIAILGGTGDLGTGLAIRWSKAGYKIVIGSRTIEKAQTAVAALQQISPDTPAQAMENLEAAAAGDIVVLTVPADHQLSTLDYVKANLTGKILIDVTVPLVPPKVGTVQLPPEGSAGKRAQDLLGEDVMVVTAYQNIKTCYKSRANTSELDSNDFECCKDMKNFTDKIYRFTSDHPFLLQFDKIGINE